MAAFPLSTLPALLAALALGCSHSEAPRPSTPAKGAEAAPVADPLDQYPAALEAAARVAMGARPSSLSGTRQGDTLRWQWTFDGVRGRSADVTVDADGARVTWQGHRSYVRDPGVIDPGAVTVRPSDLPEIVSGKRIDSAVLSSAPGGGPRWVVKLDGGETRTIDASAAQR
jgi:hypothetical protein